MRRHAVHWGGLATILLVALVCSSCTADRDVILDLGTLRVLFFDSDVSPQSTVEPESTIQAAKWSVTSATVFLENADRDLALGAAEPCDFDETSLRFPEAIGKCEGGLIVGSTTDPMDLSLKVRFSMTVARAKPFDLDDPGEDFDADGLANTVDNCPLVPNPDQEDSNQDGFGNLCSITSSSGSTPDTDGDGFSDLVDNCIWVPNPDQSDTDVLTASGDPDGIGDACSQESAVVEDSVSGLTDLEIDSTLVDYIQSQAPTILGLDFSSDEALTCDWAAGTCQLNTALVKICLSTSLSGISFGCPDPV